ncbi:MAG: hypothetical protein Q9221_008377 [Calogaya cf. arnoldii]
MLINGEKWACEACVRGHRVSNCQHSDRPLTHINKKGRPVSQCPHCRGLRKARASHVKCECGEKPHSKEECLDAGLLSAKDRAKVDEIEASLSVGITDGKTCCCTHGSRCTCALKKEYLGSVPETGLPKPSSTSLAARKPRLQSTNSDTSLTHFANGHHKPVHKHNDSHNKLGTPYTIPIPHSISGNQDVGRKSTDSLPLSKTFEYNPSAFHDSFRSAQQEVRQVKSEHGSPKPKAFPRFSGLDGPLPPLDLDYPSYLDPAGSPFPEDYLYDSNNRRPYGNYLNSPDAPVMSPACMPAVDWNVLDLGTSASFSQPPSYASLNRSSSSGGVSDFDEYMPRTAPTHQLLGQIPHSAPGNCTRQDTASSLLSQPTSDIMSLSASPASLDMDEFIPPKTTASPTEFEDPSAPMSSEKFVKHGLTVQDVQKLAHPSSCTPTEEIGELNLPNQIPRSQMPERLPWAMGFDQEETIFTPDGDERSVPWAR